MTRPKPLPTDLTEARKEAQLARVHVKLLQARRALKLIESDGWADDHLNMLSDRLRRCAGWRGNRAGASYHDRRGGRNAPIFQTEQELAIHRQLSRIELAINPYAQGLTDGLCSYVIGQGCTYRMTCEDDPDIADAGQAILDAFQDRNQWHGAEFPSLEEEAFARSIEDGEFLWHHSIDGEGNVDVRSVEPEQLTQKPGSTGDEWSFGVRTDPNDTQLPLGYWIYWGTTADEGEEVEPDLLTHFRCNVKRSTKRGLPYYSFGTLDAIRVANKLAHNLGVGAYVQASYSVVRQHENSTAAMAQDMRAALAQYTTTNEDTGETEYHKEFEPGEVDIPKGYSYVPPPSASNMQGHIEALHAQLRKAGQRWNAPEWLATSSGADMAAYTASLTAESPFVRTVLRRQRGYNGAFERSHWIAFEAKVKALGLTVRRPVLDSDGEPVVEAGKPKVQIQQMVWEELKPLIDSGKLTIQVEAPRAQAHDALKQGQVDQIYTSIKVKSPQTIQMEQGLDPDQEMANWQEVEERMGPVGPAPLPPAGPPGGTEKKPYGSGDVLLDVPDRRQDKPYSCGPGALESVLAYYGIEAPEDELRALCRTTPEIGTEAGPMMALLRKLGLQAVERTDMPIQDVAQLLSGGRLLIAGVQAYGSPEDMEAGAAGHWVVICGQKADSLIVQDPARDPSGGRREIPIGQFERDWRIAGEDGQELSHYAIVVGK